jgi:hypothetical protein
LHAIRLEIAEDGEESEGVNLDVFKLYASPKNYLPLVLFQFP